jgi:Tfp pilus assembly protein PilF
MSRRPPSIGAAGPLISACLIVKNEARMLPGCLASVAPCADEIVVVDTGSSDRTVAIAEAAGCKVVRAPWPGSFAAARNVAIGLASGRWILSIDADERLLHPARLLRLVRAAGDRVGGFLIEQHNVIRVIAAGRRAVHPVSVLRVFRRHPRVRFEGEVHERLDASVERARLSIEPSTVAIEHRTYDLDPAFVDRKQRRYLRMLDRTLRDRPDDAWARLQRGKTLLGRDRIRAGVRALRATAAMDHADPRVRALALDYLGIAFYEQDRTAEAEDAAARSLALVPEQSFAHFVRAEASFRAGAYREAMRAFARARVAGSRPQSRARMSGDYYLPPSERAYHRGRCLLALGDRDGATRAFERGLALDPESTLCRFGLAHLALRGGDPRAARRLLDEIAGLDPGWKVPRQMRARLDRP